VGAEPGLPERLAAVRAGIARAAGEAGRDPGELTLVVVTKFQPVQLIRELIELGVYDFGESRHPEAAQKAAAIEAEYGPGLVRWHFVGQIQGNKARQIARYTDVVHSLDRPRLVQPLLDAGPPPDVFLEVNLTDDPARGGVAPEGLPELARLASAAGLRVRGVMGVAPRDEDPAQAFARLARSGVRLREIVPDATELSAGMSGDYRQAIAAGATHLRIGTAITGNRPVPR